MERDGEVCSDRCATGAALWREEDDDDPQSRADYSGLWPVGRTEMHTMLGQRMATKTPNLTSGIARETNPIIAAMPERKSSDRNQDRTHEESRGEDQMA